MKDALIRLAANIIDLAAEVDLAEVDLAEVDLAEVGLAEEHADDSGFRRAVSRHAA